MGLVRMNFTTFCLIFIIICFFGQQFFFLTTTFTPAPTPTPTTHDIKLHSPREVWERVGERTWVASVSVGVGKCRVKNVSHKNKKIKTNKTAKSCKIHETNSAYILVLFPFPAVSKAKSESFSTNGL